MASPHQTTGMKPNAAILIFFIAALWLNPGKGISQITSYAVDEIVTIASGPFIIDVNNDGVNDYTFEIFPLVDGMTAARVISLGNSQVMDNSTFGYPDALNFGDPVTAPFNSGNAVLGTDVGGGGQFTGLGSRYLGLNVDVSGMEHLGWILLEVAATNDTITVHEVGYQTLVGEGITAGQTSDTFVEEHSTTDVLLYPNPCQAIIRMDWPNANTAIRYTITDLTGKTLVEDTTFKIIDVSMLESGTYLLIMSAGQERRKARFLKH